jgi:regulator of RNase E activity RraA
MATASTSRIRSGLQGNCRIPLPAELLDAIRQFETCTIADAIEQCGVRLRNEGFTRPGLRCLTEGSPRSIGYAVTYRVRSSDPPIKGVCYPDRPDCWAAPETLPTPRIAVIQDLEGEPVGSVVGEVHAAILKAFGCEAIVTNGAVRDLPGVNKMRLPMFGRYTAVSHAYTHLLDSGTSVKIFGLQIQPGDLVLADCHGALVIPLEIAADLPRIASEIQAKERRILDLCQSPEFSPSRLRDVIDASRAT